MFMLCLKNGRDEVLLNVHVVFQLAEKRKKHETNATKSNGIVKPCLLGRPNS